MALSITNRFKDIDLSLTKNPKTSDIYTLSDIDAIKRSIKLLVMTRFNERLFHPEIGSSIYGLLFENMSPETAILIETSIQDVINNFEPRARLLNVIVREDIDNQSIRVDIFFYVVNHPEPISINLNLERIR